MIDGEITTTVISQPGRMFCHQGSFSISAYPQSDSCEEGGVKSLILTLFVDTCDQELNSGIFFSPFTQTFSALADGGTFYSQKITHHPLIETGKIIPMIIVRGGGGIECVRLWSCPHGCFCSKTAVKDKDLTPNL